MWLTWRACARLVAIRLLCGLSYAFVVGDGRLQSGFAGKQQSVLTVLPGRQAPPGSWSLDRPGLLPPFLHTHCPLRYERPSLDQLRSRKVRPYLFGGQQRPVCHNCHAGGAQREKQEYCAYAPHPDRRVCPHEDQERLLQHFLDRAGNGSTWAANMLRMTPCDLWPFIKGRTLWVMGDSITQEFMFTLECFFSEWFAEDDGTAWGRVPVSGDAAAVQRSMRWGGVTPWCVELVQSTRICHIRSNLGFDWAENVWPVFLNISGKPTDIMVMNAALWTNNGTEYARHMHDVSEYIRQQRSGQLPFFIYRDSSVQHFQTHTGDFVGAPQPFQCQPIGNASDAVVLHTNGSLSSRDIELQVILEGGWRNRIAYETMSQLGIPIMRTWNESVPLWQYHHHYHTGCGDKCPDCSHSCNPSAYQIWVYHLWETLMASQDLLVQHLRNADRRPGWLSAKAGWGAV